VMRRRALARSGNAPTARVRRLISPWRRSSPLLERMRIQCLSGNAKYWVAASNPRSRHSTASANCWAKRSRKLRSAFLRPDVDGEQSPKSVGTDAVGDQSRDILDGPRPSGVDERGVEVQVRDGLGDGFATQALDLFVEPLGDPAHRGAADTLAEEHLGHAPHVPRRHAAYVRLRDGVVDLCLAPRVLPQGRGGGAASSHPARAHGDLTRRGDDASVVAAVADVDPLVTALVRTGSDQALELLVEDDLHRRLDRLTDARRQVMLEVFLRRQHEVDSVGAKGSC
jgi:hypothetical protein